MPPTANKTFVTKMHLVGLPEIGEKSNKPLISLEIRFSMNGTQFGFNSFLEKKQNFDSKKNIILNFVWKVLKSFQSNKEGNYIFLNLNVLLEGLKQTW